MKAIPDEYASWLRLAGSVISLVVATSFAAALIFDYSFYKEFDLSYQELPTSLSDHLRESLGFLNFILPAVPIGITVYLSPISEWMRNVRARSILIMENASVTKYLIRLAIVVLIPIIPATSYAYFENPVYSLSTTAWMQILGAAFAFLLNFILRVFPVSYYAMFSIALIISAFNIYGVGEAEKYMNGSFQAQLIHTTEYSSDPQAQVLRGYVIKYLERGILVCEVGGGENEAKKDCRGNIIFFPWEKVVRIEGL